MSAVVEVKMTLTPQGLQTVRTTQRPYKFVGGSGPDERLFTGRRKNWLIEETQDQQPEKYEQLMAGSTISTFIHADYYDTEEKTK